MLWGLSLWSGCQATTITDGGGAPDGGGPAADVTVHIDARHDRGPIRLHQGFVAGATGLDPDLVRPLKPTSWRFNDAVAFSFATALDPTIKLQYVLSDGFLDSHAPPISYLPNCSRGESGCFDNFAALRQAWDAYVQSTLTMIGATSIPYFDLMNEPNGSWSIKGDDILALMNDAAAAVRAHQPGAEIVAPSQGDYPGGGWGPVLDFVASHGLHIDALAWHEFSLPEDVVPHVSSARAAIAASFASHPELAPTEIHINEYLAGQSHLIPGWALGYLYYLDLAEVDWASLGCWYPSAEHSTSECFRGLDGMFMPDAISPQAVYWVHRKYGEQAGVRLTASSPDPHVVALASRDDAANEVRVLVGSYSCGKSNQWCEFEDYQVGGQGLAPTNVEVVIDNVPFTTATVSARITRIPNTASAEAVLEASLVESVRAMPVLDGTVTVALPGVIDGDVYAVVLE